MFCPITISISSFNNASHSHYFDYPPPSYFRTYLLKHNHIGVWMGAVFSHIQCNVTTCQSFRLESLSVATGPSQTTPSRPRSVSTRGRGRGHQPSPSQSGLTPRSRREQFQQQQHLQCRNNCGALFGLESSRSRHEVHYCPSRNEVS